jgi:hypothetical protein
MLKYGVRSDTLRQAADSFSQLLGMSFALHDSSFFGGDYFLAQVTEGTVYLQPNFDALDDEPFEPSWPADQFLLCFSGVDDEKWVPYTKLLRPLEDTQQVVFLKRVIA